MRKGKFLLAISLLFGLLSSPSMATEKFEYDVKLMGAEFGSATLYINGADVYGELQSNEKWSSIHFVNNRVASRTSEDGFPKHTQIEYKYKQKHKKYAINFSKNKIHGTQSAKGKATKRISFSPRQPMHDIISWLGKVRENVPSGSTERFSFKVFSGVKRYDVHCEPLDLQTIETPLGPKVAKPYDVVVTRPTKFKRQFRVWFDTAAGATPLRLVGKFKIGHGEVIISSVKKVANAGATPKEIVQKNYERIGSVIASGKDVDAMREDIKLQMNRFVDYGELARLTVKSQWNQFSITEQSEFTSLVKDLIQRSYAKRFKPDISLRVTYNGKPAMREGKAKLNTTVSSGDITADVNYKLHIPKGQIDWWAYDIVIDEVSMMRNYRNQFSKILKKSGKEGLMKTLRNGVEK
jgi:phospholipid transport system substrate-binding protein